MILLAVIMTHFVAASPVVSNEFVVCRPSRMKEYNSINETAVHERRLQSENAINCSF